MRVRTQSKREARETAGRAQVHSGFVAPSPALVAVIQGRGGHSRCASAINAHTETLARLSCSLQSWSAPVCQDLRLHFGEETLKRVLELIRLTAPAYSSYCVMYALQF